MSKFNPANFRKDFYHLTKDPNKSFVFDTVSGSQMPDSVAEAIAQYYRAQNSNMAGVFKRSVQTHEVVREGRKIISEFINAPDPDEIIFGASFSENTNMIARAMASTWKAGDEIIISELDHASNVSPWLREAKNAGAIIRELKIQDRTGQLLPEETEAIVNEKTRVVAFTANSSSIGTRPDVKALVAAIKRKNPSTLSYVDAVAYAPNASIDVQDWGADFVGFSPYKFGGPHTSILWGKREHLENLPSQNIDPIGNKLPGKWAMGTPPFGNIAGITAMINYFAKIGRTYPEYQLDFPHFTGRQAEIHGGMKAIEEYVSELTWHFINSLKDDKRFTLWGIQDEKLKTEKLSPVSLHVNTQNASAMNLATYLAQDGKNIAVWNHSGYSEGLSRKMGLPMYANKEPGNTYARIGFCYFNTLEEVNFLIHELREYASLVTSEPASRLANNISPTNE